MQNRQWTTHNKFLVRLQIYSMIKSKLDRMFQNWTPVPCCWWGHFPTWNVGTRGAVRRKRWSSNHAPWNELHVARDSRALSLLAKTLRGWPGLSHSARGKLLQRLPDQSVCSVSNGSEVCVGVTCELWFLHLIRRWPFLFCRCILEIFLQFSQPVENKF